MLKLKTTAVAVLALGSSAVFAGTMGPVCAPGNVTIPCEKSAWDLGARALYMETTYSDDLGHANVVTGTSSASVEYPEPKWGWGFMIEGSYHFNTGNDLNLNWWHWSKKTTRAWSTGGTLTSNYTIEPKWDAVNLELGQQVDFSDMKHVRFHAGAQYSRQHTSYTFVTAAQNITRGLTYNGFGPRLGGDFTYDLGNGFGVYANSAATLLIGTAKSTTAGFTAAASDLGTSKTAMVPALEAKLGAEYNYAMPQGDLGFDVGYAWFNYFDSQIGHAALTDASNFALDGLYFGLRWVGNV